MKIREASEAEFDPLARLWYEGWRDAHANILPEALARHRTMASFLHRLRAEAQYLRVAGPPGGPIGMCIAKHDELNQLYVSASARGTGLAGMLLSDGEARLRRNGVQTAWLACAIGNVRAARFYEKNDWRRMGEEFIFLDTPDGPFRLEVWRYEKALS
jgi:ribosomal protein S18 acetylase RimI-like enzyme